MSGTELFPNIVKYPGLSIKLSFLLHYNNSNLEYLKLIAIMNGHLKTRKI